MKDAIRAWWNFLRTKDQEIKRLQQQTCLCRFDKANGDGEAGTVPTISECEYHRAIRKHIEQLEAALQGIATMCRNEKTNLDVVCEVAADQAEQALGERDG